MTETISQVETDGPLGLLENLVSLCRHGAILFHKPVSFSLCLEHVEHWERIASRGRPAFSSHRSLPLTENAPVTPFLATHFSNFIVRPTPGREYRHGKNRIGNKMNSWAVYSYGDEERACWSLRIDSGLSG